MKKDLSIFFEPLNLEALFPDGMAENSLGSYCQFHQDKQGFPDLNGVDIAVVGVQEGRGGKEGGGTTTAPDEIRKFFYRFFPHFGKLKMTDLGNIVSGETLDDTYYAVSSTVTSLVKKGVLPIIIGGSHDITYAQYAAYEDLETTVQMVNVDAALDMGEPEESVNSSNFLTKILIHRPNYLFNYTHLGYQSFFVDSEKLRVMSELQFDLVRLGQLQEDVTECEPMIRDAEMVSFDLSAVRMGDSPGSTGGSPNGFYGDEACRIVRYAGMSEKLTSIGFYEADPKLDPDGRTAQLVAQMIWYFVEGFYNRKGDLPVGDKSGFSKYTVGLESSSDQLIFYKSLKSNRWWMDVPYPPDKRLKYQRHCLVPCSYSDYLTATRDEIPERWWKTYQKLS